MAQSQPREYPTSDTDPAVGDSALNTVYPYLDALLDDLRTGNIKSVNSFNVWWSQMLTTLPILGANYSGKIKEIATTLREVATGFFRKIGEIRPDIGNVAQPLGRQRRFSLRPGRPAPPVPDRKERQNIRALLQKIEKAVNVMMIYIGEDTATNPRALRIDPDNARMAMEQDILDRRRLRYGADIAPEDFEDMRVWGMLPPPSDQQIDRSALSFVTGNVIQPLGEPRLPANRPIDAPPDQRERIVQEINRSQGVAISKALERRAREDIQMALGAIIQEGADEVVDLEAPHPANARGNIFEGMRVAGEDPFAFEGVRRVGEDPFAGLEGADDAPLGQPGQRGADAFADLNVFGRGRGRRRGMTHMELLRQRLR
jgi:hypothetical protein